MTDAIEEIRERWRPRHFDWMVASTGYFETYSVGTGREAMSAGVVTATMADAVCDVPVLLAEIDRLRERLA